MPRTLHLPSEHQRAKDALLSDPHQLFSVAARVPAPTYLKLIEECIRTGKPLASEVANALISHCDRKGQLLSETFDLNSYAKRMLASLCAFWRTTPMGAITKLLEHAAMRTIAEEYALRQRVEDIIQRDHDLRDQKLTDDESPPSGTDDGPVTGRNRLTTSEPSVSPFGPPLDADTVVETLKARRSARANKKAPPSTDDGAGESPGTNDRRDG